MWDTDQLQHWAHELGIGRPTGHRPAGRRPKAWCRASSGATSSSPKAKPNAPGRPATTSSWRSARATCRPTRCRWRSPTRRSATAARSSPRTSGMEVEDAAGRVLQEFDPRPRRQVNIDPDLPRRRSWKACTRRRRRPGGTSYADLRRLPDRSRRQDRHRRTAGATPTSPGTRSLAPYPNPRIVTVRDDRGRRLRRRIRRARRAADPRSLLRQAARSREVVGGRTAEAPD